MVYTISEKKVIDEIKKLLKAEFSQSGKAKFDVESYPISMNDYKLKNANGCLLIKELGMSTNFVNDNNGYFYYDKFAWSIINVGILILFQKSYIRQDRVTEISEVCDRVRLCLQSNSIFNKNLYVTEMDESVYDEDKNWYYRTINVSFPYNLEVR